MTAGRGAPADYPLFWVSTMPSAPYSFRSLGFSILPVAFLGTSAKMIFLGRLYRGSSWQNFSISASVQVLPGLSSMMAVEI